MAETDLVAVPEPDAGNMPLITYILFLAGLLVAPATIVGLIMAYLSKSDAPEWALTHYRWLIRTFWISLIWAITGFVSTFIIVGYLILLVGVIWYIVRLVRGFIAMQKKQAIPNPASWGF